jgi:hypothetical protein
MARDRKCEECKSPMYAQDEKYEPRVTTVTYVFRDGTCPSAKRGYPNRAKVFESK